MAEIDPSILAFNAAAKEVDVAAGRAGRTVAATEKKAKSADEAVGRLQAKAEGRGAGNLATESEAGEAAATSSKKRTASYTDETASLSKLSAARTKNISQLELEAKVRNESFRNLNRQGVYAGGRQNYREFGEGGVGAIPPGSKTPIFGAGYGSPGGRLALPAGPKVITDDPAMADEYKRVALARAETERYTTSISKLAVEQNLSSQEYRKNGALTTEFIAAAHRGEITIQELGYQTAATIGKFGGWLAAGSAVYGVFAAVQKLGGGAVDAYSGVNELQRVINNVNPTTAKSAFSDLAGEFNVPIKTVTESVYQMGKVFHTQAGAIAAARAVLYSTKVGELDVADSSRYLIAILNGFHLPASKVAQVFDQINEAQNEFGITISDVEAGLAKASGTFHAAGGSYSNLLALITTAQKATGNTGSVIGTALARAPNFLRKPENEAALKEFGIKPGQAIDTTIEQAFKVAQSLSGKKLQELAAAIFGPQFGARIGTPLLQQLDLYEKVKRQTSPKASKGSAERELATQLGSVSEQVGKIGITFERLGAQLADSHALDAIGGLLKVVNLTLSEVLSLTEAFNELPDGVKRTISYVGELAIALRVLRRLNIGDSLESSGAGGVKGAGARLLSSGPIGEARRYRQALIFEKGSLEGDVAGYGTQSVQSGRRAQYAAEAASRYDDEAIRVKNLGALTQAQSKQYNDAVKASESYRESVKAEAEVQRQVNVNAGGAGKRLGEVNDSLKKINSGPFHTMNVQRALQDREEKAGINYYTNESNRPSPTGIALTGRGLTEEEARKLGTGVDENLRKAGAVNGALDVGKAEATMQEAEANVTRTGTSLTRLGSAAEKYGGALEGLLNKIGTIFFAGAIAAVLFSFYDGLKNDIEDERNKVENTKITLGKELGKRARKGPSSHGGVGNTVSDIANQSGAFGFLAAPFEVFKASHVPGIQQIGELNDVLHPNAGGPGAGQITTEGEEQRLKEEASLYRTQQHAKRHHEPVPYHTVDQLRHRLKKIIASPESTKKKVEELQKLEDENESSLETTDFGVGNLKERKGRVKGLLQAIELAKAVTGTTKDFANALKSLTGKQLGEYESDYTGLISSASGKFSAFNAQRARLVYKERTRKLAVTSGPTAAKELQEAQKEYYEAISNGVESELTVNLEHSRSPQQRVAARARALRQARAQLTAQQKPLADAQKQLAHLEGVLPGAEGAAGTVLGGIGFGVGAFSKNKVTRLKKEIEEQRQAVKHLGRVTKEEREELKKLEESVEKTAYEYSVAIGDAKFGYKASLTQDPLKQARIQIEQANADLPGAIKIFGRESQQVYSLLEQKAQAANSIVQQELGLLGANDARAAAGINPNDAIAKSKAALGKLQDELAFERAHPSNFDPKTIEELETQTIEAEVQLANDIAQEAVELRDALFQRKVSNLEREDKTVQAAHEKVKELKFNIGHAKTPAEKANLESQLPSAYQNVREATSRKKIETIEFDANIDKITTTQEIAQLENLLHDYNLSLATRRQIREQIHSLKNQEGFDLEAGNITLPTVYDIRRAIQGGIQNKPGIQINNAPRITVNNYSADDKVVGRALGHVLGTSTASAARSAGISG